jgi:hypothetical protein
MSSYIRTALSTLTHDGGCCRGACLRCNAEKELRDQATEIAALSLADKRIAVLIQMIKDHDEFSDVMIKAARAMRATPEKMQDLIDKVRRLGGDGV